MTPYHESDGVTLYHGDCLQVLRTLPAESIDAVVSDPPYGLSFMGKRWDYDVPTVEVWAECLRVLKPGGHLLAFAGTRTQHRMAVRIEDAGFEIRDMIAWVYGSGFPKSLDVSKAIDKCGGDALAWRAFSQAYALAVSESPMNHAEIDRALGVKSSSCYWARTDHRGGMPPRHHWEKLRELLALPAEFERLYDEAEREVVGQSSGAISTRKELRNGKSTVWGANSSTFPVTAPATDPARQWQGWGTALKPALEPITVARKPLSGTVAETVLQYGTGALNVDGCRVEAPEGLTSGGRPNGNNPCFMSKANDPRQTRGDGHPNGRWPANLIHDGSDEVTGLFPDAGGGYGVRGGRAGATVGEFGMGATMETVGFGDRGSAARFFYCAKASKRDRGETNKHPTVKPTSLMRYLCKLITPPGGVVLDPFTGSGSTGRGAVLEGFRFVGMELDAEHVAEAKRRILEVQNGWTDEPEDEPIEDLPGQRLLF